MAAADDYVGKTVASKYRVEQMIGEGGMGKVYRATQTALDKPVVLKVLRQALLSDARTVARFQREAKAASRLNHPNSISILDFGQSEDGAMYIAMEFVSGKDLHHILSREWPLPEPRVVRIISQVLSALADAHTAGVIHRDLKPENIMVEQRRGEPDFVKVLDFGIAKITDSEADDGPALTRAGFVCGTPEYMSPEQAKGATLDHRSDLYAVGVILYQLTSGMLPFDSDSPVGFATKHLLEVPPLPSKRRPEAKITASMERLIMKAMSKSPDERPQTAEAFRAELIAIDKERRAAPSRRSVNSIAPPRRATPVEEQATKLFTSTPAEVTDPNASDPEATVVRNDQSSPAVAPAIVPEVTAPDRSKLALVFKIATLGLVVLALVLVGIFVSQSFKSQPQSYVPPPNAPVPMPHGDSKWTLEVDPAQRDAPEAVRLTGEADAAWVAGSVELALARYQEAFAKDPQPQTALKIGEIYFQQDRIAEAKGWWGRYRRDAPGAKSAGYIDQVLP